jgi:hypothetical protein
VKEVIKVIENKETALCRDASYPVYADRAVINPMLMLFAAFVQWLLRIANNVTQGLAVI